MKFDVVFMFILCTSSKQTRYQDEEVELVCFLVFVWWKLLRLIVCFCLFVYDVGGYKQLLFLKERI